MIKLQRGPGQNLLIRKGCSSIKACEKVEGVGEGRRGNSWGGGLREETGSRRLGRDAQRLPTEWKGLFGGTLLSTPLAVKVSRPHDSQFSNSGDGLWAQQPSPERSTLEGCNCMRLPPQSHLHLSNQKRTKPRMII